MRSLSPELPLALSPARLRALLDTFGAPRGLRPYAAPPAVARAVFEGRAEGRLARAFDEALRFAGGSGRRAILEAARACGDPRADAWAEETAEDLAAHLTVLRATEKGKAKRAVTLVLALATLRMERLLPEHPTYELVTDGDSPLTAEGAREALARVLGDAASDVWAHATEAGDLHLAVFLLGAPSVILRAGARGPSRETVRAASIDVLRVAGPRVAITTTAPELLPTYAAALGLSRRPSLSLRAFHDLSPATFARRRLPRGVHGVTVVAIRVRTSGGARHETRAFDVTAEPHANVAGYVDRVTLRVAVDGAARPVDVFLELPRRIEITDLAVEPPIRALLDAIGVFTPGARADDAWSLAPFVHGVWRWLVLLGPGGVERLRRAGLLVPVRAAHVATEELRMLGATYVVREVPGEASLEYALSEDPSFPARLVGPEDRAALRLDLAALSTAMRKDIGTEADGAAPTLGSSSMLDLGAIPLGRGRVRFFFPAAALEDGWAMAVRQACGVGTTPVILVPRGRDAVREMASVELDVAQQLGARSLHGVVLLAARALGIEQELEPWRLAVEVLVVDPVTQRVWVFGVLIARLGDTAYRFVEYMAKNAGRVLATKAIGAHVTRSEYPGEAARRIKAEAEKQIEASLEGAGRDPSVAKSLFVSEGKNGYRLGVTARVM